MIDVIALISELSDKHALKNAPKLYVDGFTGAITSVYPPDQIKKILQERFFIPDDSNFDLDVYLQSAVELSVQNHIKRNAQVENFEINKRVNPPKDIDAYYEIKATQVSLEVKCPVDPKSSKDSYKVTMPGRVPDHEGVFNNLKGLFNNAVQSLELTKNQDNKLKDYLVGAHEKFSPNSNVDNLNILFVACNNPSSIQDWYFYLDGGEGLFTSQPFYPSKEYKLVDIVILSNLKYCHTEAREAFDWTLQNVFLLPFVNPHGRSTLVRQSVFSGLSIFEHHFDQFRQFIPKVETGNVIRIFHYLSYGIDNEKRRRYFPTMPKKWLSSGEFQAE